MKKLIILMGIALMAFSCYPAQEQEETKFTLTYKILNRDWVEMRDGGGNFIGWKNEVYLPELTGYIFQRGMYTAYLYESGIQEPLPIIVYNETDAQLWERKWSCDFAVGSAMIYYQENDFDNFDRRPGDVTFRFQLMW